MVSSLSTVLVLPYVDHSSQNLDIVMLSGYATILQDVSNIFEHLQPLCCPSHPRFLNSLKHLQILSFVPDVLLVRISTLTVQLRYSIASTYMLELLLCLRCLMEPSSNLSMFCVPSVMNLATILESIP